MKFGKQTGDRQPSKSEPTPRQDSQRQIQVDAFLQANAAYSSLAGIQNPGPDLLAFRARKAEMVSSGPKGFCLCRGAAITVRNIFRGVSLFDPRWASGHRWNLEPAPHLAHQESPPRGRGFDEASKFSMSLRPGGAGPPLFGGRASIFFVARPGPTQASENRRGRTFHQNHGAVARHVFMVSHVFVFPPGERCCCCRCPLGRRLCP